MVAAFFQDKPIQHAKGTLFYWGHVNIDVDIFSRCIEA